MAPPNNPPLPPFLAQQDPKSIKAWADYSKDRYDVGRGLFDEFRNRARQLIPLVGVVLGIELTFVTRLLLDHDIPVESTFRLAALVVFGIAIIMQFILLPILLNLGFGGHAFWEPEDPVVLIGHIMGKGALEVTQIVGAYYAKSCRPYFERARVVGRGLTMAIKFFLVSFLFLLGGVGVLCFGNLPGHYSFAKVGTATPMAEGTKPSGSDVPPPASAGSKPLPKPSSPNSEGQPRAQSAPVQREDIPAENPLLATPTQGVRIIGARSDKKSEEGE